MKTIIVDLDNRTYNLNLTQEQIRFAKWMCDHNMLYRVDIIEYMNWEDIK